MKGEASEEKLTTVNHDIVWKSFIFRFQVKEIP
jgi:hypothetical protein